MSRECLPIVLSSCLILVTVPRFDQFHADDFVQVDVGQVRVTVNTRGDVQSKLECNAVWGNGYNMIVN